MVVILLSLLVAAIVIAFFWSSLVLVARQIIALVKGDEYEFNRLTTPYEVAEFDAVMSWGKTHGVTREIFAKYWEREKKRNPEVLPYDVYCIIMEELTILHEPDPEIWSWK